RGSVRQLRPELRDRQSQVEGHPSDGRARWFDNLHAFRSGRGLILKAALEQITGSFALNNGVRIPRLGLGVYQSRAGRETQTAVSYALEIGYRLIDTASVYGNEADVGKAVASCGIPRKDIFITTKVWNSDQGYQPTLAAFQRSL